jgi:hypothetical protein
MANNSKAVKTVRAIAPSKTETIAPVAPVVTTAPILVMQGMYTTQHVAQLFGMRPFELRKVLRSMELYNDGAHTAYRWASIEQKPDGSFVDAHLDLVRQQVAKRAGRFESARLAAQARFAAAQAQVKAQQDADAKLAQALAAKAQPSKRKK